MKKFAVALFAMAAALAIPSAALADTTLLIPNDALEWNWTGPGCTVACGTSIVGPLDLTTGENHTAVNFYLSNIAADFAVLWWDPSEVGASLGNLAYFSASVVNEGPDQPYYILYFSDPGGIPGGTTGDNLYMIEFEPNSLSGPDGDTLALDPAATLFNIFDSATGTYIAGGQQGAMTLDSWLANDPALANAQPWVGIQIGNAGSCDGSCSENLTINSADVTTPEPTSILLLGTGLAGLAGMLRRKLRG